MSMEDYQGAHHSKPEDEAYDIGHSHGYDHANFVDAYGGDPYAVPSVPLQYDTESLRSIYLSAFICGAVDWAEEVDWYETGEDDCND